MTKRSTNLTGRKPMKASHTFDLMRWVGMSDEEIRDAVKPTRPTIEAPPALASEPAQYKLFPNREIGEWTGGLYRFYCFLPAWPISPAALGGAILEETQPCI